MRWPRRTVVVLGLLLVPVQSATADTVMDGERHVKPVYGQGSVTATGYQGAAATQYTATLETRFEPSQILPGQGFTLHAKNVTRVPVTGAVRTARGSRPRTTSPRGTTSEYRRAR